MKQNSIFCRKRAVPLPMLFLSVVVCALFSLSVTSSAQEASTLKIRGENYGISPLEKGQQPFYNRTNMSLSDVPEGYEGWKFVKINANSTYLPGPLPLFEVKAARSGSLIALVATAEKPAVCAQWAEDNGWELIPGVEMSYAAGETGVLSFYRRSIEAGEWLKVVQPATFSGAILVAPSIEEEGDGEEKIEAVPVQITSLGWMEAGNLEYNALAFANRAYIFHKMSKALTGLQFTRYRGGDVPKLKVTAGETGTMYIAASEIETVYKPEEKGWTKVEGLGFSYNDGTSTSFSVYKKEVEAGDTMSIRTNSWTGIFVLSPQIEYTNVIHTTPPPGVVIYNSKASTKKFVGSPSITVLEDGTYLASHDIFGGLISYSYVYKSTDKGKTWERISEINPLTWSKLFTRGHDLFLIGVLPRCTMGYGDVVVLQSKDGGYTWTTPKDAKSGLLRTGYYHTAPTPIVFHQGRIWKAMENQGDAYWGWGPFSSFMMSIEEEADLLDATKWTFSNELAHVAGAVASTAWLEGNPVVCRDGSLKNILRLAHNGDDKAAVVSISADGKKATFNPQTDISELPGAGKKFTIHYDSITDRYWTLSNYVLSENRPGNNDLGGTRNTVVLAYSEDLVHWTIKDTLLHHPDVRYHGFQYLDWMFEGNDIIAVSRTAWEDETGQADSQHNANFLTFHRFPNFRFERTAADPSVVAVPWYKNAESAYALTFDDGFEAHYKYAYPLLEKYGIQGTFFVNSSNLVKKGETPKERYGFEEDFKEMSDRGHEIASHSLTHANLTALEYDALRNELKKDKENIESFTGKPCLTHAYPFCLHNEVVDESMPSFFIGARQCGTVENTIPSAENGWFSVNSELLTWTYPRSLANEKASFLASKAKIDQLNGRFGVVCIHETLPFDLLNTSTTYEVATTEWLEDMCSYLSGQEAAGKVWPTTFSNIVRYAKERQNLRVQKQELSENCIQYDFSTWLDTAVYNHPLTVELTLPEGWETVTCERKSGDLVLSDSMYVAEDGKIEIDVVPDRESLVLTRVTDIGLLPLPGTASKYVIYPNPVKDVLNIENLDADVRCEIFDPQGRLVKRKDLSSSSLSQVYVGDLQIGLYYVRFLLPDRTSLHSFSLLKIN